MQIVMQNTNIPLYIPIVLHVYEFNYFMFWLVSRKWVKVSDNKVSKQPYFPILTSLLPLMR